MVRAASGNPAGKAAKKVSQTGSPRKASKGAYPAGSVTVPVIKGGKVAK